MATIHSKRAFSMIEIIFVIVVIGILATMALPKFAVTSDDATVEKGRSVVASIKMAISSYKSKQIAAGNYGAIIPTKLDDATANTDGQDLFKGSGFTLLVESIKAKSAQSGGWSKDSDTQYKYWINNSSNFIFTYNVTAGTFDCTTAPAGRNCNEILP
jgi:general secretion pathway protein G